MKKNIKLKQIEKDLKELCVNLGERHVGSSKNHRATEYVAERLALAGFSVVKPKFKCIDWEYGDIDLRVEGEEISAHIGPYSPACEIKSSFETACNIDELAAKDFKGKIAVLHGDLCKEQLMPKNFVFYNPQEHKKIISLIEENSPLAVVAITSRNPELAGAMYPFPLIEDGDFDIPSVYLTEEEGIKILSNLGSTMYLKIESRRIPSVGYNVIGRKNGDSDKRVVFCAHIDTKKGTPGALDNGTGVVSLLVLADILKDYKGKLGIEILMLNGEDYYAASGQMKYLEENKDRFDEIVLAVNTDGAGYRGHRTSFSLFNCGEVLGNTVRSAFEENEEFIEIDPWYQSDHMIFVMNNVSAIALTSENYVEIATDIAHTEHDTVDNVDINKILDISKAMKDIIFKLNEEYDLIL